MKKYFEKDGGKSIEFVSILNQLLIKGSVEWLEYDDETSWLSKKSLKLTENSMYVINNGNPTYSQSSTVVFNTKESTLAIEAVHEGEVIAMYDTFKISDSELTDLFEGTTFEFKKF